jgi:osmotically-inducible protein OsmY
LLEGLRAHSAQLKESIMAQFAKKTDSKIKSDVVEELKWDTRVKETDVGVTVKSGIVTLTGAVTSWAARLAAQDAAHRVSGVLDVANDVEVRLPGSWDKNDTDIAKAVRTALEWDVLVPDQRIQTTVSDGVVTLEGKVDFWSQHDDAGRAIRNLSGVTAVINQITVEPSLPVVSAAKVRGAIEEALERHAAHSAKDVSVSVADDKVTLSGAVPSWVERQTIEGAARGTPGVRRIENQLRIQP